MNHHKALVTFLLLALLLPGAGIAIAQEKAKPAAEDKKLTQQETKEIITKAFGAARALLEKGETEKAADILSKTADKLGDAPEATSLRFQAIATLLQGFMQEGTGRKKIERLTADLVAKAAPQISEQVYGPAAQVHSILGNYKEATKVLKEYLKKFPEPTKKEIAEFNELRAQAGIGAGVHPRIQNRLGAKAMLEKIAMLDNPPPHFELKTIDGAKVSPKDYKGKVLLIDFWATWCRPCLAELPALKKTYEKYHDKGFDIIGLSLDRDKKTLSDFVKKEGMSWKQVYMRGLDDNGEKVVGAYKIQGIPAVFLVDRKGVLRKMDLRGEALHKAIEKLVAEKPGK